MIAFGTHADVLKQVHGIQKNWNLHLFMIFM